MKLTAKETNYILQRKRAAALEEYLEKIAPNPLSLPQRFELRDIVARHILPHEIETDTDEIKATRAELFNLKNNLKRRTKLNDKLTSKALINLSPTAEALLFSELALQFRSDIDNWAQIDFSNTRHFIHLKNSINNAISKITAPQGRPPNTSIDEFFIKLGVLYQRITGHPGSAQAHFNNEPHTDFECLLYLGFSITRPGYGYPTMLIAWRRAMSRQS